jgi:hypothetical protein
MNRDRFPVSENEVFLTTGVVLGRFRLSGRKTLTVGAGYQFAVSHDHPQFENNWILSVRTNFLTAGCL